VMGFDVPAFAAPALIVPGARGLLLPADTVSALRGIHAVSRPG